MENTKTIAPYTDGPIPVQYFEAFTGSTSSSKMRKSANKRNMIYMSCKSVGGVDNEELRDRVIDFSSEYFDSNGGLINKELPKDIIACVPNNIPGLGIHGSVCFLVDGTKGNGIPAETRAHFAEGFRNGVGEGALIGAPIVGGWFVIDRVELAPEFERRGSLDIALRGANQIVRPIEDLVRGLTLNSDPCIMEPISSFSASIPIDRYPEFFEVIRSVRGFVEDKEDFGGYFDVDGFIPAANLLKIKDLLGKFIRPSTEIFINASHYAVMPGSLEHGGSVMSDFVNKTRNSLGITYKTNAEEYFDTL